MTPADELMALAGKWAEPTPQDDCTLYTMGQRTGRNQCAADLRALLDSDAFRAMARDLERLRGFAAAVMEDWSEGDLDGGTRQDLAERFGLLRSVERFAPCGDACGCSEYFGDGDWEHGQSCYRLTSLVTGDPSTDAAIDAAASGAGDA